MVTGADSVFWGAIPCLARGGKGDNHLWAIAPLIAGWRL
jgi:hypothetical protein